MDDRVRSAASSDDQLATLRVMRDKLAEHIDACDSSRDLPALTRQLSDVMRQISELLSVAGVVEVKSPLDELTKRRAARGAGASRKGGAKVARN